MSGKEIKNYVTNRDDIYYNIIIIDENKNNLTFDDIDNDTLYDFVKMDEMVIGCGMIVVYYSIKKKNM
jgi:hypothetical protein